MSELDDMALFAAVVKANGFTRAAAAIGTPTATLSRRISALEEKLGEQLLIRTTRSLQLTEAGRVFYGYCEKVVAQHEQARNALIDLRKEPVGHVCIAATFGSDLSWGSQLATLFLSRYPKISLEAILLPEQYDLNTLDFDVAMIHGTRPETRHLTRSIGDSTMTLCASPEYLARHGIPTQPDDLQSHSLIGCRLFTRHNILPTALADYFRQPRIICNELIIARQFALDGGGIAILPHVGINRHIAAADLQPVLPQLQFPLPMWLVMPANRANTRKVEVMINFFLSEARLSAPWHYRE